MDSPDDLAALRADELLAAFADGRPTPGGGAAAALAGAVAAALVGMAARLALGRPRDAGAREALIALRDRSDALRERLTALAGADCDAYEAVMEALALPRNTEAETGARREALRAALRPATTVLVDVAAACAEVAVLASIAAGRANRSAASDVAVAALLAHAALRGAAVSIRANLRQHGDEAFAAEVERRLAGFLATSEAALAQSLAAEA